MTSTVLWVGLHQTTDTLNASGRAPDQKNQTDQDLKQAQLLPS